MLSFARTLVAEAEIGVCCDHRFLKFLELSFSASFFLKSISKRGIFLLDLEEPWELLNNRFRLKPGQTDVTAIAWSRQNERLASAVRDC